ncbi:MAG TPA: class I SAM-dependent methyltransferase [Hanamia sp.]|jgi:SAM-dependent methyltransferase|nr:class I SAM-dependent methyltransferase [Hanamia sp.]
MQAIKSDFAPSIINPFYIIRKSLLKNIRKFSGNLSGKIMDFGCGSKPYKNLFNAIEYIGVDFENEGHPHDNEQIDVYYNGKNLPFEDQYFDSVLCSEVVEHVFELTITLNEINRVMKTGGNILITCPFVWNEHEVPFDYARYTRFALKDILEKNGFEITHFAKSGNFITTITQLKVIYFYTAFGKQWYKHFIPRILFKFLFVLIPNSIGLFLNKLYPYNDTLYLNNVLIAKKIS